MASKLKKVALFEGKRIRRHWNDKADILTEMFEHFGIKVIDVGSQIPKTNKKRSG